MSKRMLIYSGITIILSILFVIAYMVFNMLDMTVSNIKFNEITIITSSSSKIYDGKPLSNNGWYILSGSIKDNETLEVTMLSEITDVGSINNEIGVTIFDKDNNNITENYIIHINTGTLTVLPREITVRTLNESKEYDGNPLTSDSWNLIKGSIPSNHTIQYVMNSSITEPGITDNEIGISILNEFNMDVTHNFTITKIIGTLQVMHRDIFIKTLDAEKIWDGKPLTHQFWEIEKGTLIEQHQILSNMFSSITNPGTVQNEIGITILNELNQDMTRFYDINYNLGSLSVLGIDLTIKTNGDIKLYDGLPLTNDNWNIQNGILLDGHKMMTIMNSEIIDPGTIFNTIGVTILNDFNQDVTYAYNITYDLGELHVRPIVITIKSASANKVYDGLPLSKNEWEILDGSVLENHNLFIVVDGEITDIGEIDNRIYAYVIDENGNNVNHFYQFDYFNGKLEIFSNQYEDTDLSKSIGSGPGYDVFKFYSTESGFIYFRDRSWGEYNKTGWYGAVPYDTSFTYHSLSFPGQALFSANIESTDITLEFLVDNESYLLPYFSLDSLVGNDDVHIYGDTSKVIDFHTILYEYDFLNRLLLTDSQLTEDEIKYRTFVYEHYLNVPESTRQGLNEIVLKNGISADSNTLIYDIQNYIMNTATYNLEFDYPDDVDDIVLYFLNVAKEGICQHYAAAATLMYRIFGIPARYTGGYIGLASPYSWSYVSTDQAHAWVEIYIDGFGWVPIEVTGGGPSQGDFGERSEEIIVTPIPVKEIFEVGKVIRPIEIDISGSTKFRYGEYTYDVVLEGELSTPGKAVSSVSSFVVYDASGKDVTREFKITFQESYLQLYQYEIEVFTGSAEKIYDGKKIENNDWEIVGDLADGHYLESVSFSNDMQDVGVSKNKADLVIKNQFGEDVTEIYNIISHYGDLIITPRVLVIESASASKTYDGLPLKNSNYTIKEGSLATDDFLFINVNGSQTTIGKSMNVINYAYIYHANKDVTMNYSIIIIEGELIVLPD